MSLAKGNTRVSVTLSEKTVEKLKAKKGYKSLSTYIAAIVLDHAASKREVDTTSVWYDRRGRFR